MVSILLYLVLAIAIGGAYCFYGNKIFYPLFSVIVFLIGFIITIGKLGMQTNGLIIGLIVGVILVLIARFLFKLNLFIIGATLGILIGYLITVFVPHVHDHKILTIGIILITAVVLGYLAVKWRNVFIVLSTSATGAGILGPVLVFIALNITKLSKYINTDGLYQTANTLNQYIFNQFTKDHRLIVVIFTAVLFIVGIIYQKINIKETK